MCTRKECKSRTWDQHMRDRCCFIPKYRGRSSLTLAMKVVPDSYSHMLQAGAAVAKTEQPTKRLVSSMHAHIWSMFSPTLDFTMELNLLNLFRVCS